MAKHMKSLEFEHEHGLEMPSRMNYPVAYLNAEQMPEIADWEIGEEYEVKFVVKLRNRHETEHGINGDLELTKYEREGEKQLD